MSEAGEKQLCKDEKTIFFKYRDQVHLNAQFVAEEVESGNMGTMRRKTQLLYEIVRNGEH